jgi:hypothetical protein
MDPWLLLFSGFGIDDLVQAHVGLGARGWIQRTLKLFDKSLENIEASTQPAWCMRLVEEVQEFITHLYHRIEVGHRTGQLELGRKELQTLCLPLTRR